MNTTKYGFKPSIVSFPSRPIVYVSYGCNGIFVHLTRPAPDDFLPNAIDITNDPLLAPEGGIYIRNSLRHQHIVGRYCPETLQIIIRHKKHVYSIRLPQPAKEIRCGDNCIHLDISSAN